MNLAIDNICDSVLERANELYAEAKHDPERKIRSEQVKAILRAIVEALVNEGILN